MATLKQIRQRIKAAKNTQSITRAMKLVAAARLTKAKNRVEEARPYSEKMREFIQSIGAAGDLPNHPLLERRQQVKKVALVLMTAERGLCGSFNTNLLKAAQRWLEEQSAGTCLVSVGKKGNLFFSKRGYEVIHAITLPTAGGDLSHAVELTSVLEELFTSGQVDAVHLCYSKFYSPIRQEPQIVQLLPIEPPTGEESTGSKEYDFEPGPEELMALLLPKYLLTVNYQAMLESAASEHGARMTAMSNATDNAGKMISELSLTANRVRQATITKEILEIVGGAEALKN
ncbi:ATP synthase F1 subunit gamma [Kamptonema cortianum]|nr:ATP synthase F1 subunit gamma [Geitlerinema splendidum]MDK3155237.1 ATP synthase F1 subunit gamma [Kamptonema cortianum]